MSNVEHLIRDYLKRFSKGRTFDYAKINGLMHEIVSIFQRAKGDIFEDILINAYYSTPGLFHHLIEVNEIGKALGDKYSMLPDSLSLSSMYSSVLLNFVEGPLKHVLLYILYALKKSQDRSLNFKGVRKTYRYITQVVSELRQEIADDSNKLILSSILANVEEVNLRFIRNKVAHHDYYIVTKRESDRAKVKVILFVENSDLNNLGNIYFPIEKLGECIRWVENLIVVLISSIDVFIKASAENQGFQLDDICDRCEHCGSWQVDLSKKFAEECHVCSRLEALTFGKNNYGYDINVTYMYPNGKDAD